MSKKINEHGILELFLDDPRERHLREVARECTVNPMTARKYLELYTRQGLLQENTIRGDRVFKPDERNPQFIMEKKLWNYRKIILSGLISYLEETMEYPAIILFGSYAKGENHPKSDIDLFILTNEKKQIALVQFEKKLHAQIQVFLHTKQEFKKLRKTNPELLNNVLNGAILSGFIEVF